MIRQFACGIIIAAVAPLTLGAQGPLGNTLRQSDSALSVIARTTPSAEAFVTTLDTAVIVLMPGQPIRRGRRAGAAALASVFANGRGPSWRSLRVSVAHDGSLAYTCGYADIPSASGDTISKYVIVWRAVSGAWRPAVVLFTKPSATAAREADGQVLMLPPGSRTTTGSHLAVLDAMRADADFAIVAAKRGLAEAFGGYAAPDAAIAAATGYVAGPDRIRAAYAGVAPGTQLRWEPVDGGAADSGDLAFTVGEATWSAPDKDGGVEHVYSKYLTIWQRQADGSWKYVLDAGNARPAP